ncbi:MAG: MBL fold metallo-hydrolase [Anaerolineae bacterium]|nr:MBL fold metallo-hydrolase [Anaerolineae bacterium]
MTEQPQAIVPGLYSLAGAVNLFVLDDAESGVTIIDAGMPGSTKRVLALLAAIGRTPQDVQQILITHADLDHVGSLKGLVKATGAPVFASKQAAHYIQKRQSPPHLGFPFKAITGVMNFFLARAVPVDQIVTNDQMLPIAGGIRVINTPGHTPDHVSFFWERERVLLVGDLLRNFGGLTFSPPSITWDMESVHSSTRRVLELDPVVMVFGHGETWTKDSDPDGIKNLLASVG